MRDRLLPLAVPTGEAVLGILPDLEAALDGGPAVLPYTADGTPPPLPPGVDPDRPDLAPGTAVVVGTSGSTGDPKLAMLTAEALRASATATHEVLGGSGRWLLSMPGHHVAGIQVLVRSLVAGKAPVVMDLADGFTAAAFAEATARLHTGRTASRFSPEAGNPRFAPEDFPCEPPVSRMKRKTGGGDLPAQQPVNPPAATERTYAAVVPTQLARLLADDAGTIALSSYDAVLVGGGPTPETLRERAAAAGVTLVPTYGMTETCGGCVYAGRPIPGAAMRVEPGTGRVFLGGATIAAGYLGLPDRTARAFSTDPDGVHWFATDDAGRLVDGVLHLDGRLDDLVNTGGLKVAPRLVEDALVRHVPGVLEAVVVGIPDDEWGQAVAAVIVLADTGLADTAQTPTDQAPTDQAPTLDQVRAALRPALEAYALPRRLLVLAELPLRGPGKPDRAALRRLLSPRESMGD